MRPITRILLATDFSRSSEQALGYAEELARRFGAAKRRFFTRVYPDWTWQSPEKVLTRGS